jgi:predicted O-methyltransferase YrrM
MKSVIWGLRRRALMLARVALSASGKHGLRVLNHARVAELDCFSPIPAFSLADLFRCRPLSFDDVVRVLPGDAEAGSTSWFETLILCVLAKRVAPKATLEMGTFRGRTTWHLFENTPPEAHLYTIDLPPGNVPSDVSDELLAKNNDRPFVPRSDRITQILQDTRTWDGHLPERVQLAFIDASHHYADVKNDTEKAMLCIDDVGCICWHDCLWTDDGYGVSRYLNELREQGRSVFRVRGSYEISSLAVWMSEGCQERVGLSLPGFR